MCISALALATLLHSPCARGHAARALVEPLPFDSTDSAFAAPRGPLLDPAPAPLAEPPERARRWFELNAEIGVSVPSCAQSNGYGCASLVFGSEFAIALLARKTPYFAFGAGARLFTFDVGHAGAGSNTRASASLVGLVGRVYFMESGLLDPYLELELGGGSLTLNVRGGSGGLQQTADFAAAVAGAAGLDVALSSSLRLGCALAWFHYFPASVASCDAELGCSTLSASSANIAVGATSLGLRLTFAAGDLL